MLILLCVAITSCGPLHEGDSLFVRRAFASWTSTVTGDCGGYECTYILFCTPGTEVTYAAGETQCPKKGREWYMATPSSFEAAQRLQSLRVSGTTSSPMYVGGARFGRPHGNMSFTWQYGRRKGLNVIGNGGGPGTTTRWGPAQPDNFRNQEDVVTLYNNGVFNDDYQVTSNLPSKAYCTACERATCDVTLDCVSQNTQAAGGAGFPYCYCVCKSGWRGGVRHPALFLPS